MMKPPKPDNVINLFNVDIEKRRRRLYRGLGSVLVVAVLFCGIIAAITYIAN